MRNVSLFIGLLCVALLATTLVAQTPAQQGEQTTQVQQSQARAQSWSGSLVDASCKSANPTQDCKAAAATTMFGIYSDSKLYKFDQKGNEMAMAELKKASDKVPSTATVTGTMDSNNMITVASLKVQ